MGAGGGVVGSSGSRVAGRRPGRAFPAVGARRVGSGEEGGSRGRAPLASGRAEQPGAPQSVAQSAAVSPQGRQWPGPRRAAVPEGRSRPAPWGPRPGRPGPRGRGELFGARTARFRDPASGNPARGSRRPAG